MRRNAITGAVGAALVLTMFTVMTGSAAGAAPQRGCVPTWQQVEVSYSAYNTPPYFTTTRLGPLAQRSVSALSSADVRFAGQYETNDHSSLLLQRWTGRTADSAPQQLPVPPWFAFHLGPRTQSFSSSDEGWVLAITGQGGQNGGLAYHWRDGRWTMAPTAVSPNPLLHGLTAVDVVSVSPDEAWLVGNRYPVDRGPLILDGVHIQRWDGTRWSVVDNPLATVPHANLISVTTVSADDVWAVGYRADESGTTVPLVMRWNGTEWRTIDVPTGNTPAALYGISGTGPDNVWAVGGQTRSSDGLAVPLVMHWNGTEWRVHDVPDVGNSLSHAVYAASPTEVWAAGQFTPGADAYFLHWDGRSWQRVRPPGAASGVEMVDTYEDIHGTGPNDVWAVGVHQRRGQTAEYRPLVAHLSCGRNQ